ncbi:hypothetical protein CHH61_03655 [Shouchella clausii]|jgi:hypothetical protein|uniref:Uncharacterized protein n=1 Tax=Shouchella clausii TaxID=79880 RepID=A0A268S4C9_SHOCL|nr:hypothetical protein [Shouchella clausii]PAF27372.1 hypothetical protein CHH61_03655 [Shouchella clausii]
MSLFGDSTFKQEIYDSFHYIIHNFNPEVLETEEHLKFLHENIFYIIEGKFDKINSFIVDYAKNRNMTYSQVCKELAEMYAVIIEYDIVTKMNEDN